MEPSRKRLKYDAAFKIKVVELANKTSNHQASETYGVDRKCVRDWVKNEQVLKTMPKKSVL